MLALDNVSKSFGGRVALAPTTLTFPLRQTTALIGPSGCGKSTIIRLMVGLLEPDQGTALVDGVAVTASSVLELRRRTGYVVQDGGLFPHLTARGNVTLLARHLGWAPERIGERLATLVALTRFPESGLDRYPNQLSGGQRQRVALMRALMLDPGFLLLDEPLGALDPLIRSDLQHDLREIFQSLGKTVVLVTHDLAEAGYLADRIVLLREGQVIQEGTLAELVQRPADRFVTRFVNAQRSPLDTLAPLAAGREDEETRR